MKKKYDDLTPKEREKLNTGLLALQPYVMVSCTVMVCILILGVIACLFILGGGILNSLFALMIWGAMILYYAILRIFGRKYKDLLKNYLGEDVFIEE